MAAPLVVARGVCLIGIAEAIGDASLGGDGGWCTAFVVCTPR